MSEVTIFGSITEKGALKAVFTAEYYDLIKRNRNKRIIIKVEVLPEDGTMLQEVYFKKAVLPCLQKGFYETGSDMSLSDTKEMAIRMCPATADLDIDEKLSKEQMRQLIDWAVRLCAEQFGIIVPEPGTEI